MNDFVGRFLFLYCLLRLFSSVENLFSCLENAFSGLENGLSSRERMRTALFRLSESGGCFSKSSYFLSEHSSHHS